MKEKENIGSLFNRIAARYDNFNHLSSMGIDYLWRKQAVRKLSPVGKALDVAVGTGDLAIELIRQNKAEHVEGIDLSTKMMQVGQQKVARKGLQERISFTEGSALNMPYPDNSFDLLTCGYGVRNFSQLDQGLKEFQRVLRPGGQLLILEFSHPQNKVIAFFYDIYFKYIMTTLGTLLTGGDKASFRYFYASVLNFIWGDEMKKHLEAAGFHDVTYHTQTFGISTIYLATK